MKPSEPGTHSLNECRASLAVNFSTIQQVEHLFIPKKTKLTHYRHLAVPRTERNPLTETAFTLFLANKSYHIPRL
jgi:hypothetical protein